MEKTVLKFGDIEIEKQTFHQYKRPVISAASKQYHGSHLNTCDGPYM